MRVHTRESRTCAAVYVANYERALINKRRTKPCTPRARRARLCIAELILSSNWIRSLDRERRGWLPLVSTVTSGRRSSRREESARTSTTDASFWWLFGISLCINISETIGQINSSWWASECRRSCANNDCCAFLFRFCLKRLQNWHNWQNGEKLGRASRKCYRGSCDKRVVTVQREWIKRGDLGSWKIPSVKIVNLLECGTSGRLWPFKIFIFYLSRDSQKSLVTNQAGLTLKLQKKVPARRIPTKELVPLKIESAGLTTALSYSREWGISDDWKKESRDRD